MTRRSPSSHPPSTRRPNLPELVDRLQQIFEARGMRGEIVLVDDGSTDDTAE